MINTVVRFFLDKSSEFGLVMVQLFAVALAWITLYHLNNLIFSDISINQYVTWIFLPAFIRMLAVMVFDWAGAIGLILGAIITRDPANNDMVSMFALATISGLAPFISMKACQFMFKLPYSFEGLRAHHLFTFAFAGSVTSAGLNHFHFNYFGFDCSLDTFIPMLIGDFVGTLIMLYLAAFFLRLIRLNYQRS
jgi:hypothetical protein